MIIEGVITVQSRIDEFCFSALIFFCNFVAFWVLKSPQILSEITIFAILKGQMIIQGVSAVFAKIAYNKRMHHFKNKTKIDFIHKTIINSTK